MTDQARTAIGSEAIEAVADRGCYNGEEILACEQAGGKFHDERPLRLVTCRPPHSSEMRVGTLILTKTEGRIATRYGM